MPNRPISVRLAVLLKAAFSKTAKMNSRPAVGIHQILSPSLTLNDFSIFEMASSYFAFSLLFGKAFRIDIRVIQKHLFC
jgi:hypothetical protein